MHRLGPDEIACRYRAGRTGREEAQWEILWLWTRTENSSASESHAPNDPHDHGPHGVIRDGDENRPAMAAGRKRSINPVEYL
jgi:hypothetical protein